MVAFGQAAVVETAGAEDVVLDELVDIKLLVTEAVLSDEDEDDDDAASLELVVETTKLDVDVDDVVGCADAG